MTNTESPKADMDTSISGELTGEQRLARRRRNFFLMIGGFLAIGFAIGVISGMLEGLIGFGTLPAWLIFPAIAIMVLGLVWFTRFYFRKVDELDLMDNLWASLIGLYFYIAALPTWHIIHNVGFVGAPDQWTVYWATLIFSLIAYLARKLGLR